MVRVSAARASRVCRPFCVAGSLVHEALAWQPAQDERGNKGSGTGEALDLDPRFNAGAHQQKSRIADGGGSRIAAQAGRRSGHQVRHHTIHHLVLVVCVEGPQARLQAVQALKGPRGAGVFRQHEISRFNALGPRCEVLEVADEVGTTVSIRRIDVEACRGTGPRSGRPRPTLRNPGHAGGANGGPVAHRPPHRVPRAPCRTARHRPGTTP